MEEEEEEEDEEKDDEEEERGNRWIAGREGEIQGVSFTKRSRDDIHPLWYLWLILARSYLTATDKSHDNRDSKFVNVVDLCSFLSTRYDKRIN